jgi:drug/metabolite transporter (DMT)-like permease
MMLSGCLPLITAVLNYLLYKKKLAPHEKTGMGILIFGNGLLYIFAVSHEEPI